MSAARRTLSAAAMIFFHQTLALAQLQISADVAKDCGARYRVGEKCTVKIHELHPTQGAVGYEEVRRKTEELSKKSEDDREDFRKKKRIPVVVGPNQQLYMIDHHHSALSMLKLGFDSAYIEVVGDLSASKSIDEFWAEMLRRKWCYPFDGKGQEIPPTEIPRRLEKLDDDPYRSVAGIVRERGGFDKEGTPFEEFAWARRFQKLGLLEALTPEDYETACHRALALLGWGFWSDPQSCSQHLRRLLEILNSKNAN